MSAEWWHEGGIRAVTLYPWASMRVEAVVDTLLAAGVNTVFPITKESDGHVFYDSEVAPVQSPGRDILGELVAAAPPELKVVPNLSLLLDKQFWQRHPETVQRGEDGTEIRYPNVDAEWLYRVCPNHESVREHVRRVVEEVVAYDIDGVLFNHFDFQPVRAGEESYLACCCSACDGALDGAPGSPAWVESRCAAIDGFLDDISEPLAGRDDLLTTFLVESFDQYGASSDYLRETFGVDLARLAPRADVLVPNTDHVDLGLSTLWIRDTVRWLVDYTDTPVVPVVRAAETPRRGERLPPGELFTAVQMALHGGAAGANVFCVGTNTSSATGAQWARVADVFSELARLDPLVAEPAKPREL
jgi:hypothetical protein